MLVLGTFLSARARTSVWVLSGGFVWIFIAFFSSPEELFQASALFWSYLPLGLTSLLLSGNVSSVGYRVSVWVLSVFFLGFGFFQGGIRDLSEGIFQGFSLLWP